MKLSELFALPYPEGDDLGAIALYMQNLAYNIEELLNNVEDPLGEFPSRPLVYVTNLADNLAIAGSASDLQDTTLDFDFTAPMLAVGDFDYVSWGDDSQIYAPANRTGLWAIGACVTSMVATTPNVETWRYLGVRAAGNNLNLVSQFTGPRFDTDIPGFSSGGSTARVYDKVQDANVLTPGTPMCVDALAWIPPGTAPFVSPDALFSFDVEVAQLGNTSSAIPIAASSVFAWAVWLATGEETITQVGG